MMTMVVVRGGKRIAKLEFSFNLLFAIVSASLPNRNHPIVRFRNLPAFAANLRQRS